ENGWQEVRTQRNHPSPQKQEQRGYTITSEIEARLGLKPTAHISSSVSYRDSAARTKSECEEQTLEVAQSTSSSETQVKVKNSDKQLRDFNRQQLRHPKRTDISKIRKTEKTEVEQEPQATAAAEGERNAADSESTASSDYEGQIYPEVEGEPALGQ